MITLGPPITPPFPIDPGPDLSGIRIVRYIDNNFHEITAATARSLCPSGKLPAHGWETCIEIQGYRCYVTRTITGGQQVWALHVTNHKVKLT